MALIIGFFKVLAIIVLIIIGVIMMILGWVYSMIIFWGIFKISKYATNNRPSKNRVAFWAGICLFFKAILDGLFWVSNKAYAEARSLSSSKQTIKA